ncbi:DUF4097 family beta strand repeat-containing protein [Paenibacillus kobensis]|uniref:DUF4097 family beta strand repeat-containing protein n=1 Tax=Paenibacillus kobensis TaxID=59841 RepID=UPI000FD8E275|nr:DUF4097 family beta strand repeat-containing protein [Paenibacillus kobensis]
MRKWIGIGLILIAIGVAGLFSPWSHWRSDWVSRADVNEQYRVSADGVKRLSIELDSEDVRVVEGTQSDIVIRVEGKVSAKNSERKKLDFGVADGTLRVKAPDWGMTVGFNFYSLKVTIEVPSAAYESIKAETDSGNIELRGLAFGEMKLDSDSGDITASQMKSKSIHMNSDSGDLVLEDTEGDIIARSDSGDFAWKAPQLLWSADVKSDSGDVTFNVEKKPDHATVKFEADSGDGVVKWNGDTADNGDSIKEVYGNGAPLITVVTDSGDFVMSNE